MTFQTIELSGQRFVILPEAEFRKLQQATQAVPAAAASILPNRKFAVVEPVTLSGAPASEMLLQDRR